MQIEYQYPSPSMCLQEGDQTVLGLSPDLSREEKVSFRGKLKHPLIFRDAMLMLREIVISDMSQKKRERVEFFAWLDQEIERRVLIHEQFMPNVREDLKKQIDEKVKEIAQIDQNIANLVSVRNELNDKIKEYDVWKDYYRLERDFWKFIKDRDMNLWMVLDPVITVHPDQVSFEAFSLDESTYGCLSVEMDEFEMIQKPKLGTTNIDFSAKLAREMERFRTYTNVELSVNPEGFAVDTGVTPEYLEKKIDLPETWIKGFNQVSAAACLGGIEVDLAPVDMYDICSFLRRHKAQKSPRYMKWILEPKKHVRIIFEPWGTELELKAIYNGKKKREEKIWGRRRWLVMEKILPIANSFKIRLLGFGMPQFITADLGLMKLTIGFTSWSANDWVKGTAFNIMAGFIGEGNDDAVYQLLKEKRMLSIEEIQDDLGQFDKKINQAGIGMLLRKGEGYFDPIIDKIRFRQLCNIPIPEELYEITQLERDVGKLLEESLDAFRIRLTQEMELTAKNSYNERNPKYQHWRHYNTPDYNREFDKTQTEVLFDNDSQITKVDCSCRVFKRGPKNISAPCSHILALYINAAKFTEAKLKPDIDYDIKKLFEELL